ncbi:hypothetical protein OSSY52_21070 [Tepiditoga spiralis]|uniref:Uncharacterized protein n=1 Tax=Tepiditoga spiralis TaxID=2108365 RepID=A0A7G1G940_9BACT|nr:hypothetical protein [Tepiditoga spiralis]BBE31966.1 hypothetical protein OSSY52_21070 [Tepiditoga spiralis]
MKKFIIIGLLLLFSIIILYFGSVSFYNFRFLIKPRFSTPVYSGYVDNFVYIRKYVNGNNSMLMVKNTNKNFIVVLYFKHYNQKRIITYSDSAQLDFPDIATPIIVVYKQTGFLISYPISSYTLN